MWYPFSIVLLLAHIEGKYMHSTSVISGSTEIADQLKRDNKKKMDDEFMNSAHERILSSIVITVHKTIHV